MTVTTPPQHLCKDSACPCHKPEEVTPPTWAVVHLMGHARYAGRLTEEEKFGVKMGRVDVPNDDGTFTTVYFGGASVYKIEVVTEAVARTVRRASSPAPVSPWDFPKVLPAAPETTTPAGVYEEEEPGDSEIEDAEVMCADCNGTAAEGCDAGRCANHCDQKCDTHCQRSMGAAGQVEF